MTELKSKVFHRITNKDIYDTVKSIETHLAKLNGKTAKNTYAIAIIIVILVAVISRVV